MIGKRAVLIYSSLVVSTSMIIGWLTNQLLLPDFVPFYNLEKGQGAIGLASSLIVSVPEPVQIVCSVVILLHLFQDNPARSLAGHNHRTAYRPQLGLDERYLSGVYRDECRVRFFYD